MGFTIRYVLCALLAAAALVRVGATSPADAQVQQTVLWTFLGGNDGAAPSASLIADERGALYGTTQVGGAFPAGCFGGGCGVVFKLTPPARDQIAWTETTLRSFSGGSDGSTPFGGLFARNQSPSSKKSLYGTTTFGGALDAPLCFGEGCGTVFKLTDGSLTTLWSFTGGSDGAFPVAALIGDEETGTLYGTAESGGTSGNGVVFKIDTIDQTLTTIYNFSGGNDGSGRYFRQWSCLQADVAASWSNRLDRDHIVELHGGQRWCQSPYCRAHRRRDRGTLRDD